MILIKKVYDLLIHDQEIGKIKWDIEQWKIWRMENVKILLSICFGERHHFIPLSYFVILLVDPPPPPSLPPASDVLFE